LYLQNSESTSNTNIQLKSTNYKTFIDGLITKIETNMNLITNTYGNSVESNKNYSELNVSYVKIKGDYEKLNERYTELRNLLDEVNSKYTQAFEGIDNIIKRLKPIPANDLQKLKTDSETVTPDAITLKQTFQDSLNQLLSEFTKIKYYHDEILKIYQKDKIIEKQKDVLEELQKTKTTATPPNKAVTTTITEISTFLDEKHNLELQQKKDELTKYIDSIIAQLPTSIPSIGESHSDEHQTLHTKLEDLFVSINNYKTDLEALADSINRFEKLQDLHSLNTQISDKIKLLFPEIDKFNNYKHTFLTKQFIGEPAVIAAATSEPTAVHTEAILKPANLKEKEKEEHQSENVVEENINPVRIHSKSSFKKGKGTGHGRTSKNTKVSIYKEPSKRASKKNVNAAVAAKRTTEEVHAREPVVQAQVKVNIPVEVQEQNIGENVEEQNVRENVEEQNVRENVEEQNVGENLGENVEAPLVE